MHASFIIEQTNLIYKMHIIYNTYIVRVI